MGSTSRRVLTTKRKAFLWFLGLLFLLEVLSSNVILESILTFGFAGVVPGTSIVLSPNAVILVTALTLTLLFFVILLTILLKRPKERVPADLTRATEALAAVSAEGSTQPIPQAVVSDHPSQPGSFARIATKLQAIATLIRRRIMRFTGIGLEWLDVKLPILARALQRISQVVWAVGMITFVFARKWTIIAAQFVKRQLAVFWHWLVPYLWKFDTWLELQVRAFTKWARYKSRQYHSLTVLISMYRQYKKIYSESPIASLFAKRPASRSEDEV